MNSRYQARDTLDQQTKIPDSVYFILFMNITVTYSKDHTSYPTGEQ